MLYRYTILLTICFIPFLFNTLSGAEEIRNETGLKEREPKTVVVTISESEKTGYSFFQPRILTIQAGDTVTWINDDSHTHFVTYMTHNYPVRHHTSKADDDEEESDQVDNKFFSSSEIEPGKTFTHTFNKPGVYKYFCFTHPIDMQGAIIVNK